MHHSRFILIAAILLQLLVVSWARTRFIIEPPLVSSAAWNEQEDIDNTDIDHTPAERTIGWPSKARRAYHFGMEERRKKYLGDSNSFQGGHSLQGLWAMPGRR